MYEKFYKLTGKPFAITPDQRFFYASKGHKKAFSYLCYGMVKSEGFVVITGDPGLGKSTVAYRLLAQKSAPGLIIAHITSTQINAYNLLRMISSAFHMEYEGRSKTALIRDIEVFLHERDNAGQRCVLVVDEAQNLPYESLEELRMLSNIQEGPKALLQTFLLGQNLLVKKLNHSSLVQFRQRVIASLHLKPLQLVETIEYIHTRLKKVNWKKDPDISSKAFHSIFQFTEGNPRKINLFCDRLFLSACMDEAHFVDVENVELVMDELSSEISGQFKFDKQAQVEIEKQTLASVSFNANNKNNEAQDNPGIEPVSDISRTPDNEFIYNKLTETMLRLEPSIKDV